MTDARTYSQPPAGRRRGVTELRWLPGNNYSTIIEDTGQVWIVTCEQLPEGYSRLDRGVAVTFTGDRTPPPGMRYPRAEAVELDAEE